VTLSAGKLDRRIVIEINSPIEKDASGADIERWMTLATPWAEYVPPAAGSEPYTADQHAAFVEGALRIRKSRAYTIDPAKHRIRFDGRIYNILGWVEGVRGESILITIKARLEEGAPPA
jgi:SPP1 family predicted phage head-tail adaptor